MNKAIILRIEEIFKEKLQAKTSWGRNDVLILHTQAVNQAVLEFID